MGSNMPKQGSSSSWPKRVLKNGFAASPSAGHARESNLTSRQVVPINSNGNIAQSQTRQATQPTVPASNHQLPPIYSSNPNGQQLQNKPLSNFAFSPLHQSTDAIKKHQESVRHEYKNYTKLYTFFYVKFF